MSQSSLTVTEQLLGKTNPFPGEGVHLEPPSSAKILLDYKHPEHRSAHMLDSEEPLDKHFQLKGTQDTSSDCSAGFKVNKEIPYILPVKHPIPCKISNHPEASPICMDEEDIRPLYAYDKKTSELQGFPFGTRKIPKSRKLYDSMKNVETNRLSLFQNRSTFSLCYSDLRSCSAKTELELNTENRKSPVRRSSVSPSAAGGGFLEPRGEETIQDSEEGDVGELKIRYEDYQDNKTDRTVGAQQEAHYKFFPSVILSNCLNRKKSGNKKLGEPCSDPELLPSCKSKLKVTKKHLGATGQRSKAKMVQSSEGPADTNMDSGSVPTLDSQDPVLKDQAATQTESVKDEPNEGKTIIKEETAQDQTEAAAELVSCCSSRFQCLSEAAKDSAEHQPKLLPHLLAKGSCFKPALPVSKYTLRAKRRMKFSRDEKESSPKNLSSARERLEDRSAPRRQDLKQQRRRRKEPPVIIKYIIINRFKGQKNMLVKMSRVSAEEPLVLLTPHRLQTYHKLAPLKDFWPKVPESPAVKLPIHEPRAKKQPRRKPKVSSTNKTPINLHPKPRVRRAEKMKRGPVLPSLPPPRPCYCELAEDHDSEYADVMVELGYLSDRSPSPAESTPPRCWSPTDPLMSASSSEPLLNPRRDPRLSAASRKPPSKPLPKRAQRTARTTKPRKGLGPKRTKTKSAAPEQRGRNTSASTTPKPRRSCKRKPTRCDVSEDRSPPSSQDVAAFQQLGGGGGGGGGGSSNRCQTAAHLLQPKVEECETSIMEAQTRQQACQTAVVKLEFSQEDLTAQPGGASPGSGPQKADLGFEMPSGLVVLKQLLQKRRQGQALPVQVVGSDRHAAAIAQAAALLNSSAKRTKPIRTTSTAPRKPRTPKSSAKDKKPRSKKSGPSSSQPVSAQQDGDVSDCGLFLSQPGLDSCTFLEDSLSPELPPSYSFDINTLQHFSSPYSCSQFVLTDKSLPLKFLSDISQEPQDLPAHQAALQLSPQRGCQPSRTRPTSPELFDPSEDRGSNPEKTWSAEWDLSYSRSHILSPFQDFHCERKEFLFSAFDPVAPLPLSSASFADLVCSPTSELPESVDGLTSTTPSSSPHSISSVSQVRASQLQRGAGGGGAHVLKPLMSPPSREEILSSLMDLEMSQDTVQEPFCSDPADAPDRPM